MKLLLRQFGDECYVWKNAEMNDEKTFIVDGRTVNQGNVVSIYRDNRNKFVKCSHCGTILKNADVEIKEHRLKSTTSTTCFGCPNLRTCEEITKSIKYVLQDDGKYIATVKSEMQLKCRQGWGRLYDINSEDARTGCKYRGCIDATMKSIQDIFTECPGIFDDIITIDCILDTNFEYRTSYRNGTTLYKLKGRDNIVAVVNKIGIVDHFNISRYSHCWDVVYSKKYNEFYKIWNGLYIKWNPDDEDMPHGTLQRIKDRIAKLYA